MTGKIWFRRAAVLGSAIGAVSCSSSGGSASPAADAAASTALPATYAVTADWLDHRLSIVDFDALVAGGKTRKDVVVGTVDLSSYTLGPLYLRITPDGKTALVSVSAGFFSVTGGGILVGAGKVPTGPTTLLFVDLATHAILGSLDTGDQPSSIVITHDGTRAFVAHAGASTVTEVDVNARTIVSQVDVGGTFAEEITLDDSGTVGAFTCILGGGSSKSLRTFAVADMAGTLSPGIPLNSDAAGVPFFPGTKTIYVVLAYNPLTSPTSGYALVDATNPSIPVLLATETFSDSTYIDYQAIPAPARGTVLVPVATKGELSLREYALDPAGVVDGGAGGGDAGTGDSGAAGSTPGLILKDTYDVAPTKLFGAFGLVVDAIGHVVLTMPDDRQVAVLDLTTRAAFTVPWDTNAAPMGIDRH
jgi:hypothetical protein